METTATAAQIAPETKQVPYANFLALKEKFETQLECRDKAISTLCRDNDLLKMNLAFWKRHYYHAQNQISRSGITPYIHITTLGAQIDNYEFWEVEQLANGKLKVESEKLKKELHHLNLLYLNALEQIRALQIWIYN